MPDLLMTELDEKVLTKLEARARQNNRSVQNEILIILKAAVETSEPLTDTEVARRIRDSLRGQQHSDSAELLREDRMR
jgi:plasmid stability protein